MASGVQNHLSSHITAFVSILFEDVHFPGRVEVSRRYTTESARAARNLLDVSHLVRSYVYGL